MREISLFPGKNFLSKGILKRIKRINDESERKRKHIKIKEDKGIIMDVHNGGITPEMDA